MSAYAKSGSAPGLRCRRLSLLCPNCHQRSHAMRGSGRRHNRRVRASRESVVHSRESTFHRAFWCFYARFLMSSRAKVQAWAISQPPLSPADPIRQRLRSHRETAPDEPASQQFARVRAFVHPTIAAVATALLRIALHWHQRTRSARHRCQCGCTAAETRYRVC